MKEDNSGRVRGEGLFEWAEKSGGWKWIKAEREISLLALKPLIGNDKFIATTVSSNPNTPLTTLSPVNYPSIHKETTAGRGPYAAVQAFLLMFLQLHGNSPRHPSPEHFNVFASVRKPILSMFIYIVCNVVGFSYLRVREQKEQGKKVVTASLGDHILNRQAVIRSPSSNLLLSTHIRDELNTNISVQRTEHNQPSAPPVQPLLVVTILPTAH
ncbi:hypothetical protein ACRALDRAFT_1095337 [Sodiomyces alcalophilus JCM 7366]|uniref:uncharacterized protein n=1 Tax=Sodiomyces alcalophilus JCM 7366 TaxID=591952 RepID=UPI0039B490FE